MLFEQILEMIKNSSITELKLLQNTDTVGATLAEHKMILQALLDHPNCGIKILDISGIKLDQEGFSIIADILYTNKTITMLNLINTGLNREIGGKLLDVLHLVHSFRSHQPTILLYP